MPTHAICMELRDRMKMQCKIRRSSRRTARTNSRESTSCVLCAASILVCLAACTCTSGMERCWRQAIRGCSASSINLCSGQIGDQRRRVANNSEFQEQVRQLGKLVAQFDELPDGATKTAAKDLMQLLMDVM